MDDEVHAAVSGIPDSNLRSQANRTVPSLESFKGVPIAGAVGFLGFAAASVMAFLYWDPSPEAIESTGQSFEVMLGPFGFAGPLVASTIGYQLPWMLVGGAIGMALGFVYGMLKIASPFKVTCPNCGAEYTLGTARTYKFACPECFTIVYGKRGAAQSGYVCEYCGLQYIGPEDGASCPSCLHTAASTKQRACKQCQASIPKDARLCTSCDAWFGATDVSFLNFPDVSLFAAPARRAYTLSSTKTADDEVRTFSIIKDDGGVDTLRLWAADDIARRVWLCSLGAYAVCKSGQVLPSPILLSLKESIDTLRTKVEPAMHENDSKYAEEKKESVSRLLEEADQAISSTAGDA